MYACIAWGARCQYEVGQARCPARPRKTPPKALAPTVFVDNGKRQAPSKGKTGGLCAMSSPSEGAVTKSARQSQRSEPNPGRMKMVGNGEKYMQDDPGCIRNKDG